jgi:CheY-like chemotaxis protein
MALQSAQSLLDIINDILDLSKIESGKMELDEDDFSLREAVDSTVRPLALAAKDKGLRLYHAVDTEIPDLLRGDKGRLRQVLTNILGNAVKFTERGTVSLSVKPGPAEAGDAEGGRPARNRVRLAFTVKDTGIGIAADNLATIFDPFAQAKSPLHVRYGGTGLGLSISRQIVELMGGRIWVESTPGKGSTFSCTVSLAAANGTAEDPRTDGPEARPAGRPLKILLAEDNAVNSLLARTILEGMGHRVTSAATGLEALDTLRREDFDVVLMDVRMPDMDGVEATRRIRAGETKNPAVRIVALTAHALKGDRERFVAAGMDDYLSKPLDLDELDRALERIAGRGGSPGH